MSIDGAEWGWLAVPATALGAAAVKALGWLRRMEREAGHAGDDPRRAGGRTING